MNKGLLSGWKRKSSLVVDQYPMGTEGQMPAQTTTVGNTDTVGSAVTWAPDMDPFEMYQGAGVWKVPEGGSGIWLITYSSNVTVSGAVTLCRTNIVMGGSGLQANQANPTSSFEPHGGTNDGYSGCWMGALQAGETFHVTFNCVGGTSATFTMIHFSAYRIDAIPASQPFQNR